MLVEARGGLVEMGSDPSMSGVLGARITKVRDSIPFSSTLSVLREHATSEDVECSRSASLSCVVSRTMVANGSARRGSRRDGRRSEASGGCCTKRCQWSHAADLDHSHQD